jgi:hypothetical protein
LGVEAETGAATAMRAVTTMAPIVVFMISPKQR